MQDIIGTRRFKNSEIITPGIVGTVGDTIGSIRLKQSAPDMAMRYDSQFSGPQEVRLGSNVQDGFSYSYASGGGPARTLDSKLERKSFKTVHGWIHQDLRAPDKLLGERLGSTGRYDWYNRVANIYQAKVTGDMFLPLPGVFAPTSMTRGSQVPRIVAKDYPRAGPPHPSLWGDPGEVIGSVCVDPNGKRTFREKGFGGSSATNVPGKISSQPTSNQPKPATTSSTTVDLGNVTLGGAF